MRKYVAIALQEVGPWHGLCSFFCDENSVMGYMMVTWTVTEFQHTGTVAVEELDCTTTCPQAEA
jgi:hypothetical protein